MKAITRRTVAAVAAGGRFGRTWHRMTGLSAIGRLTGGGFSKPKVRIPGHDLAGRIETVGGNVTRFRPATRCSAGTTAPTPSMSARLRTASRQAGQPDLRAGSRPPASLGLSWP